MKPSLFKSRIRFISIIIFIFSSILITKLVFVQIIHKNYYAERADKQYATPAGNIFDRGTIFFSKKDNTLVAAGTVASGYKLAIDPNEIVDKEAIYAALSPYIKIDHTTFIDRASKPNDPYEEIATHLTKEQADQIDSLHLHGVSIYKDNWRFYPGGTLASQTLGFLAYKGNDKVGQYGLERYYDSVLSKPKNQEDVNFFAEVFSNLRDSISSDKVKQGDIVTTIEPSTQHILESELSGALNTWSADQAGGIIMNPQNGEIYAIAGLPDFDLNDFGNVSNVDYYRNPDIENVFEFGSVIKPLVMAAALDLNLLTPDTTYFDKGVVTVNNHDIYNFDKKGRGLATMQTVLDQSLNTGMVFVAGKLGHDNMRTYLKAYGLGDKTGIDLPNETSGLIKNLESPRDIEYADAAFGQGIAITPIEAVRAFSSIINGGNLVTPHLVKQIRYNDGSSKTIDYPITKQGIIKKETSVTISRMLVHVFESYYNGKYKFTHYSVGSKTGTAQIAMENGKGYYPDRHTHSFFGFFPAYDPKFIIFLFLKNPKHVDYSSETLIGPFVDITKFLMNYYDVPPDR
ncbi:MAG: penicillin-binding protein 2 [Patescibacteria group bacterium]|nr:penicillin-binding protein 2 [Patescibacteria group bacterium]